MLNENAGFQKLLDVVLHLLAAPSEAGALRNWFQARWSAVSGKMEAYAAIPEVSRFISTYADSLAEDLIALTAQDVDLDTELAAIDSFEELARQAHRTRDTVLSTRRADVDAQGELPGAVGTGANSNFAIAA